jgi:protoheme IX farnesyltransferase
MHAILSGYYKLAKPGIIYGNLLSMAAGFFLASQRDIDLGLLLAVGAGTALVIGSGCAFNNYLDRDIDAKMERTKKRALPAKQISGKNALIYASVLAVLGFLILGFFTNALAFLTGVVGLVFYVVVYGIAKRRTPWGTVVGSIPGATPPVAGYLAVTGVFDEAALLLFLILVVWQMPHFYAIAIFRLQDYKAAGIPVLPAVRSALTVKKRILAYVVAFILSAPLLTLLGFTGFIYALGVSLLGLAWLWKGINTFGMADNAKWARGMFGFSLLVLLGFSALLSFDVLLP